jgi:uncharacterized membrane protein
VLCLWRLQQAGPVYGPDLAFFTQLTWNLAHGEGFQQTVLAGERMSGLLDMSHFIPAAALYAPLQALWAGPEVLVMLQGAIWGLALVPVVRLATAASNSRLGGAVAGALYLFHPLSMRCVLADFRFATIGTALLLFAIERLARGRPASAVLLAVLACAGREDLLVTLAISGPLALAASRRPWRRGHVVRLLALPALVAVFWYFLVTGMRGSLTDFVSSGNLFTPREGWGLPPSLLQDLPAVLRPVLLTVFLAPEALLLAIPVFWGTWFVYVRDSQIAMADSSIHYLAPLGPALAIAAGIGCGRLGRWLGHGRGVALAVLAVAALTLPTPAPRSIGATWWKLVVDTESTGRDYQELEDILASIPDDAGVIASMDVVPWVAARPAVYWVDVGANEIMRGRWRTEVEYALLSSLDGDSTVEALGPWSVVTDGQRYRLLRRERCPVP